MDRNGWARWPGISGHDGPKYPLGILIPSDPGTWPDPLSQKDVNRPPGIEYYRNGFRRINADVYQEFGKLVNARYVLAFSCELRELSVFDWAAFYKTDGAPLVVLPPATTSKAI